MMDRLQNMQTFIDVVDTGSFTATADKLGLTRAAVSKHVQQLENHLGARLLNRTTRRVALSDIGRAFHDRCIRILADLEEAELAVSALHETPVGTLNVNAPMSFGTIHLAPAVADFMAAYPELHVTMTLNDRVVDVIEEGFDISLRIGKLADSSLIARNIGTSQAWLCATPNYLEQHGTPLKPGDLKSHRCLHYGYLATGAQWHLEGPEGLTSVPIRPILCANNGEALVSAALHHLGILMTPSFIAGRELQAGRLIRVLPDYSPAPLPISLIYPPTRYLSAKVRLFIDFLSSRFGPTPYWDLVD